MVKTLSVQNILCLHPWSRSLKLNYRFINTKETEPHILGSWWRMHCYLIINTTNQKYDRKSADFKRFSSRISTPLPRGLKTSEEQASTTWNCLLARRPSVCLVVFTLVVSQRTNDALRASCLIWTRKKKDLDMSSIAGITQRPSPCVNWAHYLCFRLLAIDR